MGQNFKLLAMYVSFFVSFCVCAHAQILGQIYLEKVEDRLGSNGASIGNGIRRIEWSHDR